MSLVLTGRNEARLKRDGAPDSPRRSAGQGRDRRRRPLDLVRRVRAARSRRRPPDRGADQQRRVWQLRPVRRGRSRTGRPTKWPSTSAPWSPSLARSCPECSPDGSGGILNVASDHRVPARAVSGSLRGEQGIRAVVQPGACGPRPVPPAWRSRHSARVPPVPASSTRSAPKSATRRSTASSPTPSPSSRPACGRWTRAGPWSSPACGTT